MKTQDIFEQTTNTVIRQLEEGVPPWVRLWRDSKRKGSGMLPSNLVSGKLYSGSNVLLLWLSAIANGHQPMQYCTYHQANGIGARVRKGQRAAAHLIFNKPFKSEVDEREHIVAKLFTVFHISQLEEVPEQYFIDLTDDGARSSHEQATALVDGSTIKVNHGGNQNFYSRETDEVWVPPCSTFSNGENYWQMLNHQLILAVGHQSRLNREFSKRFGNDAKAFEELVAELGSAFLCARLGIPAEFRSSSYIENWLKILKQDAQSIFTAASHAGRAADWLWYRAFPNAGKDVE